MEYLLASALLLAVAAFAALTIWLLIDLAGGWCRRRDYGDPHDYH